MLQSVTQEEISVLEQLNINTGLDAKLIIYNDEINTFDWVIQCLIEICQHTLVQAQQCALIIHHKGKYIVQEGNQSKLQPMCQALVDRGIHAAME